MNSNPQDFSTSSQVPEESPDTPSVPVPAAVLPIDYGYWLEIVDSTAFVCRAELSGLNAWLATALQREAPETIRSRFGRQVVRPASVLRYDAWTGDTTTGWLRALKALPGASQRPWAAKWDRTWRMIYMRQYTQPLSPIPALFNALPYLAKDGIIIANNDCLIGATPAERRASLQALSALAGSAVVSACYGPLVVVARRYEPPPALVLETQ